MESTSGSSVTVSVDVATLFDDLVRLETELWDMVDRRLRDDHDLPLSWFEPMQVIGRVANCRVLDIAEALSITVGGVSKLVDRIEHAGWCDRAPNPNDARSSVIALTHAGQRMLEAAKASFDDELGGVFEVGVSAGRLRAFASTTRELRQHIADQHRAA